MSESETPVSAAQPEFELVQRLPHPGLTLPLIVACLFGLIGLAAALPHPWLADVALPDDLARLAQVRDFYFGQAWFDLNQARLDPPSGIWMHWSRFVDLPLAGLYALGSPFGHGEAVMLLIWPFLLTLVLFVLVAQLSRRLVGESGLFFGVFFTCLFPGLLQAFSPGRIDHHNVQILLCAALLFCCLRLEDGARAGILAGCASALMVAIGLETLPIVALAGFVIAALWIWDGPQYRAAALAYGATFAIAATAVFVLSVPPARYGLDQCDSISRFHVTMALIGGAGLAVIVAGLPAGLGRIHRLAALTLLGILAGAVAAGAFPHCLGDPYAFLDPRLREVWLDNVSEARSALQLIREDPLVAFLNFSPLVFMILVGSGILLTRDRSDRRPWLIFMAFAAVSVVVSIIQVRFIQFAQIYCIPVAAWAMLWAYRAIQARGVSVGRLTLLIAIPALATPWVLGIIAIQAIPPESKTSAVVSRQHGDIDDVAVRECQGPLDRQSLAAIAQDGVVAVPIFYGSTILGLSDLPVLAGPYHRGQQAILDAHDIFSLPPAQSEPIVRRRNIAYLIMCLSSANRMANGERNPGSLTADLEEGNSPPWLQQHPETGSGFLRIYQVGDPIGPS